MGDRLGRHAPHIFYVNWFRKNAQGKWLWPGYGENSRVLKWVCERVEGSGKAVESPIGFLPAPDGLDLGGLDLPQGNLDQLLSVDIEGWKKEVHDIVTYYEKLGDLPASLKAKLADLEDRLAKAS